MGLFKEHSLKEFGLNLDDIEKFRSITLIPPPKKKKMFEDEEAPRESS